MCQKLKILSLTHIIQSFALGAGNMEMNHVVLTSLRDILNSYHARIMLSLFSREDFGAGEKLMNTFLLFRKTVLLKIFSDFYPYNYFSIF